MKFPTRSKAEAWYRSFAVTPFAGFAFARLIYPFDDL
jgi:hypothetical protein